MKQQQERVVSIENATTGNARWTDLSWPVAVVCGDGTNEMKDQE